MKNEEFVPRQKIWEEPRNEEEFHREILAAIIVVALLLFSFWFMIRLIPS